MAVGPGRWGSSNIDLGVNVSYADIDNITVLVEVGRTSAGNTPELSYGTHFFQDLIEADIICLPVFPDKSGSRFNNRFFTKAPSILSDMVPDCSDFADVIKVIDVPAATGGSYLQIAMDSNKDQAIGYFSEPTRAEE